MSRLVGCDVGGTFTDLILLDETAGTVRIAKVPTTVENQAFGFMAALRDADADLPGVDLIVHGTTTTTNALLERKVARCGLITTAGFRDVLELGRRTRPNPYGMTGSFTPLIARQDRLEVAERLDATGEVLTPLDEDAVRAAAKRLADAGCESLVIHFLHAYVNPAHELRAAEIAAEVWPNPHITTGHAILAQFREYERGTAAAVNGAIRPVLDRYVRRLRNELSENGYAKDLLVMQGNGGSVSSAIVSEAAINTVMSGPASGVIAAAYTASGSGVPDVITYDMGGTSSDVGLIRGGIPSTSAELQLEYGMPIHVPMVDVHTIGAGGGSIAFINEAGLLQVGPRSAGATPGPICYGRGGTEPTITDANLVLGRLNPERLLSVDAPISLDDLRARLVETVGGDLGLDATQTAAAIIQVANNRMAGAIRMVSLARGHDPRDFALFAFGGAGPLHAVALARELAIPRVLVPARPGITNAIGCAVADLRHDYVRTINTPLAEVDMAEVAETLRAQIEEGRATLEREGADIVTVEVIHDAAMQFQGQSHMLTVEIDTPDITAETLQTAFEEVYFDRFALRLPEIKAVLVSLHTAVIGRRERVSLASLMDAEARADSVEGAKVGEREVWFDEGTMATPIYSRERLPLGAAFDGPAIVEQLDSTTVIDPDCSVTVDDVGNMIVSVPQRRSA